MLKGFFIIKQQYLISHTHKSMEIRGKKMKNSRTQNQTVVKKTQAILKKTQAILKKTQAILKTNLFCTTSIYITTTYSDGQYFLFSSRLVRSCSIKLSVLTCFLSFPSLCRYFFCSSTPFNKKVGPVVVPYHSILLLIELTYAGT